MKVATATFRSCSRPCTLPDRVTIDQQTHRSVSPAQVLNELVMDRGMSPFLTSLDCYCDDNYVTNVQVGPITVQHVAPWLTGHGASILAPTSHRRSVDHER